MGRTWHYCSDGTMTETVEEAVFAEHCRTGQVTDSTMVWTEGMASWQTLGERREAEEALAEAARKKAAEAAANAQPNDGITRRACAKCEKEWPEMLMTRAGLRWLCLSCHSREVEADLAEAELKANQPAPFWSDRRFVLGAVAAVVLGAGGFFGWHYFNNRHAAPPSQAAEAWAEQLHSSWPRLVLPGEVYLKGWPRPVRTANTCLVVDASDHVLGVGFSGVFQPGGNAGGAAVPADQLARRLGVSLAEWRMGDPAVASAAGAIPAVFTRVHGDPARYSQTAVLLLEGILPLPNDHTLPATPLRLRKIPVQKDLKVFVVSSTPVRPGDKQGIHVGAVQSMIGGQHELELALTESADLAVLVGAPALDEGGHLLGIVSGSPESSGAGGRVQTLTVQGAEAFAAMVAIPSAPAKPATTAQKEAAGQDPLVKDASGPDALATLKKYRRP